MEAMGVILGVVGSKIVVTKQKNLLSWLPGVQTDLVAESPDSECRVRLGNKYLKLDITITQSGPNIHMV